MAPVGGCLDFVRSAHSMTQLSRLNLRGNDINVNSRKVIMDLERVKEGTLQVLLSPCLVFIMKSVQCSDQDMNNYLDAGCCVYHQRYDPVISDKKLCASSLVPVVQSRNVRIIGKKEIDFFNLNLISALIGDCYCPAGSKGYYEFTVVNDHVNLPTLGFCSKNWAHNLTREVGRDKETWGFMVDGAEFKYRAGGFEEDLIEDGGSWDGKPTLAKGDVIGLGCEIFGDAESEARRCQTGWKLWKAGSSSNLTDIFDGSDSPEQPTAPGMETSGLISAENHLPSAKEIYELEKDSERWGSDTVSSSECGGTISIWIFKKSSQKGVTNLNSSELKPDFEFTKKLPGGLKGLCPAFSCDSGKLRCNLGGKGWDDEFHSLPHGYKAMGSFLPPSITPNMPGVFTVIHVPNSLPVATWSSGNVEKA
jgi:hypothetical protein